MAASRKNFSENTLKRAENRKYEYIVSDSTNVRFENL